MATKDTGILMEDDEMTQEDSSNATREAAVAEMKRTEQVPGQGYSGPVASGAVDVTTSALTAPENGADNTNASLETGTVLSAEAVTAYRRGMCLSWWRTASWP